MRHLTRFGLGPCTVRARLSASCSAHSGGRAGNEFGSNGGGLSVSDDAAWERSIRCKSPRGALSVMEADLAIDRRLGFANLATCLYEVGRAAESLQMNGRYF